MEHSNEEIDKSLAEICMSVLVANDRVTHTVPSGDLYPHQWLWDSCFSAIGIAHYNPERAKTEITSLLKGQWHNGMVPHMVFEMGPEHAADRSAWRSWVSSKSPDHIATSGITQPPLLAEAVWRVGHKLSRVERQLFFKKVLPKLFKYHQWLYSERDPHQEGLTIQINPYETGFDNTPPWMNQLREHSRPAWIAAVENFKLDKFINVARRDTRKLPPEQRMKNIDALMLWDSVIRLRRKRYDINKILHHQLFAIEDVAFNSILVRNNQIIGDIAKDIRIKVPTKLQDNFDKSKLALESLWDDTYGVYLSRDFVTNKLLRSPTIASLMPLYAGTIPKERADKLVKVLTNDHAFWLKYPLPSVPRNIKGFDQNRYWQGPTWVNTNWLIIDGLNRMGYVEVADKLRDKTIAMVSAEGPWEYFNPHTGQGLGAKNFSWTAALTLDLLNNNS
ncbi:glycoside hydrolase [Candidatus Saccharibacteria bacterium]|nr:glycoside hydrolase [Candidatus Saccharibacteria bacterium]